MPAACGYILQGKLCPHIAVQILKTCNIIIALHVIELFQSLKSETFVLIAEIGQACNVLNETKRWNVMVNPKS